MAIGVVTFFRTEKGWGAISSTELPGGLDAFVHFSVIEAEGFRSFDEGDEVEFDYVAAEQDSFRFVATRARRRRSVAGSTRGEHRVAGGAPGHSGAMPPDAHTPTVLITGATDGLGRSLADRVAAEGARPVLHGRDPERLDRAADEIARAHGVERPDTHVADLAVLAQVSALAGSVRARHDRLDVLVNNAGIGAGEPDGRTRRTSADGHELRFAVNHLAGFLLTLELLGLLHASAPARIVLVSSLAQDPLDFDDLMIERGYDGGRAYARSKLAQVLAARELAPRLAGSGVTVTALHPGTFMPTKIVLQERGGSVDTLETGVDATARLALDASVDGMTGAFFDRLQAADPNPQAEDPDARLRLWERSVDLVRPHLSGAALIP